MVYQLGKPQGSSQVSLGWLEYAAFKIGKVVGRETDFVVAGFPAVTKIDIHWRDWGQFRTL